MTISEFTKKTGSCVSQNVLGKITNSFKIKPYSHQILLFQIFFLSPSENHLYNFDGSEREEQGSRAGKEGASERCSPGNLSSD